MIDRCIGAADIGQDENNKQLQSAQSHKLSMDCALHSSNVRSVRFDVVIDCHEMLNWTAMSYIIVRTSTRSRNDAFHLPVQRKRRLKITRHVNLDWKSTTVYCGGGIYGNIWANNAAATATVSAVANPTHHISVSLAQRGAMFCSCSNRAGPLKTGSCYCLGTPRALRPGQHAIRAET